jgi:hypothetical protein
VIASKRGLSTLGFAWALCGLSVAFVVVSTGFQISTTSASISGAFGFRGLTNVVGLVFSGVGLLITTRRPGNIIGWVFLTVGMLSSVQRFGLEYAVYDLIANRASLPGARMAAWIAGWIWVPFVGLVGILVPHLFPRGEFLSRRWRTMGWFGGAAILLNSFAVATLPGGMDSAAGIENPFGIDTGINLRDALFPLLYAPAMVAAALSLGVRFHRSGETQRAQIKWLAYAAALLALTLAAGAVVYPSAPRSSVSFQLLSNLTVLALGAVPAAVGVAILKYRLYDIDRLINRTLVYGLLTALLAVAYLGLVVVLQGLIPGAGDSDLTIAGSTLAVAALFRPLRARVQDFIDRRFYRRKFDAQRTVESFSSRLREDVDLDHLSADLLNVVGDTMKPVHASLWLRTEGESRAGA